MSQKDKKYSAFVCHATEDQHFADELVEYLEAKGNHCWLAPRDVRPGRDYGEEIVLGIEQSKCLVLLLSEQANLSPFVKREVERAVSKQKPIFPVRIEDVPPAPGLELFISATHWIDAWPGRPSEHFERLAYAIDGGFIPPTRTKPRRRLLRTLAWVVASVTTLAVLAFVALLFLNGAETNDRINVSSLGRVSSVKSVVHEAAPSVSMTAMTQTVAGISVNLRNLSLSNDKKSIIATLSLTNTNKDAVMVMLVSTASSFVIPGVVDSARIYTKGIALCDNRTSICLSYRDSVWSHLEPGRSLGGVVYTAWETDSNRLGSSLAVGLNIRLAVKKKNESKPYDVSFDSVKLN